MKICFIGDAGHINLLSWARSMANNPVDEVHILTFNKPFDKTDGIKVYTLQTPLGNNKLRYFLGIPKMRKIVNSIKPDIVIGYRMNSYGLMAVNSGFRPVVVVAQGSDIFYKRGSVVKRMNLHYVLRRADLIHTWEVHMRDRLLEYGADGAKVLILPKGVDTEIFKPSERQDNKDNQVLISTRQLRKTYNHVCILKALALVLKEIPTLQYFICGEGEHKTELRRVIDSLGIASQVHFLGRVDHNDLPALLGSSDAYVSMQPSDGVSASLLEAMACGVFPIVTDIEANRIWIKDGVNGFLIPADDYVALAKKIEEALRRNDLCQEAKKINIDIVQQRASMGKNMRTTLQAYSDLIKNFKSKFQPLSA